MRRTVVPLVVAAVLAAFPATATAETYRHVDPSGDVETATYDPATDVEAFTPTPDVGELDVNAFRVSYPRHQVRARLTFTDLTKKTKQKSLYQVDFITNEDRRFGVFLEAGPHHWRGVASMGTWSVDHITCKALTHHIDYKADVITMTIPRTCLSSPRWIRVAALALQYFPVPANAEDEATPAVRGDDAQSAALHNRRTWSRRRIHRG